MKEVLNQLLNLKLYKINQKILFLNNKRHLIDNIEKEKNFQ